MAINLTDALNAATVKGKIADAKQVFLSDDATNVEDALKSVESSQTSNADKIATLREQLPNDVYRYDNTVDVVHNYGNNSFTPLFSIKSAGSNVAGVMSAGHFNKLENLPDNDTLKNTYADKSKVEELETKQAEDLAKITEIQGKLNGIDNISQELNSIKSTLNDKAEASDLQEVKDVIPAQASKENKLADKDFVNSSIATNTATFRGTHNSLAELEKQTADANDYGIVISKDEAGNTVYSRYKYVEGEGWEFEFALNNSSFTAEQWKTITSGITEADVEHIRSLPQASDILTGKQAAVKYQPIGDYATKNELDVVETLAETVNKGLGELEKDLKEGSVIAGLANGIKSVISFEPENYPRIYDVKTVLLASSSTRGDIDAYRVHASLIDSWDDDDAAYTKITNDEGIDETAILVRYSNKQSRGLWLLYSYRHPNSIEIYLTSNYSKTWSPLRQIATTEDIETALEPIVSQIEQLVTDDIVISEEIVDSDTLEDFDKFTREELKKDLFVDMWNTACGETNAEGGYNKSTGYFELNGLTDITYEEAIKIYAYSFPASNMTVNIFNVKIYKYFTNSILRTIFPLSLENHQGTGTTDMSSLFCFSYIERIVFQNLKNYASYPTNITDSFKSGSIIEIRNFGVSSLSLTGANSAFSGCTRLVVLELANLTTNLVLGECKSLNLYSLDYIVSHAKNSSPISIVVHQDIYNALTETASYPFNGGTQQEWQQLLQDAAEKQISFVTA